MISTIFAIKGLLVALFMPPLGFATLIVVGLLIYQVRPRFGIGVVWASTLALMFLAMPVFSMSLLTALEHHLPIIPPHDNPPAAIVVLGADMAPSEASPSGARVGQVSLERLRTAAELWRRTHLPILVSGGIVRDDLPAIADVMADSLREDFQVPVRWVEPHSHDTWENASYSASILRDHSIHSVYVVTHAWHMRRALIAFRHTGIAVTAAPCPIDEPVKPDWGDVLPQESEWDTTFTALREWVGLVWYSFR